MAQSSHSSDSLPFIDVSVPLPMSYLHLYPGSEKPLLLFFHGYSDSGMAFVRRAFPHDETAFEILAPNGLFPVPVKKEDGWRQAFAWYFADYSKDKMLIPPSVSALAVAQLVQKLGLEDRPKILLGFSQGGFFLPFVLPHLKNVKKMFAIGAAFRKADYPSKLDVPLDAIHGSKDEIITLQRARESFEQLREVNPDGEFFEFQGLGHTMNPDAREFLKSRIEKVFL